MKTVLSACLIVIYAATAACSSSKDASKGNFAAAIDAALAKRCITVSMGAYTLTSNQFPAAIEEAQPGTFTSPERAQERNAATFAPWEALAGAGLVQGASGAVKPAFGNGTVPGRTYSLTDEGKKALKEPDGMTFCAGHMKVREVIRYTEPTANMGATMSEVRYTTEAVDVPDWARSKAMLDAFPDLKAELGDTREHRTALVLNNDGWEAELSPF